MYIYRYTVLSTQVHARGLDEISVFHDTGVLREFKIPLTTLPYSRARVICRYTCRRQKGRRRRRRRYTEGDIRSGFRVFEHRGGGVVRCRPPWRLFLRRRQLLLVSGQSTRVGRLLRGYEIPGVGRGSFPRTGRKARERGRRDPGRKS